MTSRQLWFDDPPPWNDYDREGTRDNWLKHIDDCLYHLFQEEQAEAASSSDTIDLFATEQQIQTKSFNNHLSDEERSALLEGMTSEIAGKWRSLAKIIRAGDTSIEFNRILAELIEFGGFHPNANFDDAGVWNDFELSIHNQFIWICDLLAKLYPYQNSKAIIARAKKIVAHFIVDDDSKISLAEAKRRVRDVTRGLESRHERARFKLLRARLEKTDQFMLGRCRVYTRK